MSKALLSASSLLCSGVTLLTPEGVAPLPIEVGEGQRRWQIDEQFRLQNRSDCESIGQAHLGRWLPDGEEIVFVASAEAIGVEDQGRMDVTWTLYRGDPKGGTATPILPGVRHPNDLRVSPDGEWLALVGEVDGHGEGVFAVHVTTGRVVKVYSGPAVLVAWAPDGTELATIVRLSPDPGDFESDLLRLRLGDALR